MSQEEALDLAVYLEYYKRDKKEILDHLKTKQPSLYVAALKSLKDCEGSLKEISDLFAKKEYFTWYVHMILLPKLSKLRAQGSLKQNQTK